MEKQSELTELLLFITNNPNYHTETLINGNITHCAEFIQKVHKEASLVKAVKMLIDIKENKQTAHLFNVVAKKAKLL